MRIEYDRGGWVVLMAGHLCLDRMTIHDYADAFGPRAAAQVIVAEWRQRAR